jgi:predicted SAM-dependent methyltransferase
MSSPGLKLHLGCGTVYLPGYINIDYPLDQQTSQHALQTPVDLYADITTLHYETRSVEEVRLHHVFEHFDRATALRLLVEWYDWLTVGGILTIETPDFDRCVKAYLFGNTIAKGKILRHLFGSQDAHWAVHYDGWDKNKFKTYLSALGYRNLKFKFTAWRGTYNITIKAQKISPFTSLAERKQAAERLLRLSLVDDSPTEQKVLSVWMKTFNSGQNPTDE